MSQAQATPTAPAVQPGLDDVQPVAHETVDRIATGTITVLPFIALGIVGWQVWNDLLHWSDVAVFLIMYLITGLGVTVGFHRHLTHRAFKAKPWVRGGLAIAGSMAIEGPVTAWVADHRKHHAFSDKEGDPHSPHVGHEGGLRGALSGLFHAHVGWLFIHTHRGAKQRYAPDLIKDPLIRWVDRTFLLWVLAGLLLSWVLGYLIGGTLTAAWTGLLWGGGVRMLVVHHVTYSINSLCHFFGERRYPTDDHSRNLLWLALPTLGESWHNNHHAFPTSAAHGLRKRDIDPSAAVIRVLERLGLVWDVVRITPERQAQKASG
jgi:stearoyl-CoA desaturase (delta-9 desaturase)